jgi:hypothetical protein
MIMPTKIEHMTRTYSKERFIRFMGVTEGEWTFRDVTVNHSDVGEEVKVWFVRWIQITEKVCSKCKEIKPLEEFRVDKTRILGVSYNCRLCERAEDAIYREKNRDQINAKQRARRAEEKMKAVDEWLDENADADYFEHLYDSPAFDSGYSSYERRPNPYYRGSKQWREWNMGFYNAYWGRQDYLLLPVV